MGASGAGKDSVIGEARRRLGLDSGFAFATRFITRAADAGGETHIALSRQEFAARRATGFFALDWDSHGLSYGIGGEIDHWMQSGLHVVVNGSREYLPSAARRYESILPVLIEVSSDVLRGRLVARGREAPAAIEARLTRAATQADVEHPALVRIRNDGPLAETVDEFLAVIGVGKAVR
jgi:ribose 1,5-bisphosphokinase